MGLVEVLLQESIRYFVVKNNMFPTKSGQEVGGTLRTLNSLSRVCVFIFLRPEKGSWERQISSGEAASVSGWGWIKALQSCQGLCGNIQKRKRKKDGDREPDSPLEVHCGDVEDDSFKPQDHEEPLGEGAVSDALAITSCLK